MRAFAVLITRLFDRSLRAPFFLLFSLVQPVIWLALFGSLFSTVVPAGDDGTSYYTYLAPGLAIMSAVLGSSFTGIQVVLELQRGLTQRLFYSPASVSAIVMAPILHGAVLAAIQALLISALGFYMGGGSPTLGAFVSISLASFLIATVFSGLSVYIAILTQNMQAILGIMNFLTLPLTFMSSILLSYPNMPKWMTTVASANPVEWASTTARADIFAGGWTHSIITNVLLLVAFAVMVSAISIRALARHRKAM
ncbi:MAG: ABC transporter permease [Sphingomonadaceae bacterium]|nr:ABC transporter permease [Sphingomonadaceae bacterium]